MFPAAESYMRKMWRFAANRRLRTPLFARRDPVGPRPGQPLLRAGAGAVFATHKTRVAQPVDDRENLGVIDLALVRLLPRRHGRDLDMTDERQMALEAADEIAADNLHMIKIELD